MALPPRFTIPIRNREGRSFLPQFGYYPIVNTARAATPPPAEEEQPAAAPPGAPLRAVYATREYEPEREQRGGGDWPNNPRFAGMTPQQIADQVGSRAILNDATRFGIAETPAGKAAQIGGAAIPFGGAFLGGARIMSDFTEPEMIAELPRAMREDPSLFTPEALGTEADAYLAEILGPEVVAELRATRTAPAQTAQPGDGGRIGRADTGSFRSAPVTQEFEDLTPVPVEREVLADITVKGRDGNGAITSGLNEFDRETARLEQEQLDGGGRGFNDQPAAKPAPRPTPKPANPPPPREQSQSDSDRGYSGGGGYSSSDRSGSNETQSSRGGIGGV